MNLHISAKAGGADNQFCHSLMTGRFGIDGALVTSGKCLELTKGEVIVLS